MNNATGKNSWRLSFCYEINWNNTILSVKSRCLQQYYRFLNPRFKSVSPFFRNFAPRFLNFITMKRFLTFTFVFICQLFIGSSVFSQTQRALWGSINGRSDATTAGYKDNNGKVLISWRMLPGDNAETGFDLYRRQGSGSEVKIASNIKGSTNYQDTSASGSENNYYRLTYANQSTTLATYTLPAAQVNGGLPYISIPLRGTTDVSNLSDIIYQANDCSVGDLDGDGQMEVVVKRLLTVLNSDGSVLSDGTGGSDSDTRARHTVIWDAYKLDGTFMWRVKSGPNIILGNSSNFAVVDLDGDGKCEFVTKTGEGTVFGDGAEIGDTDNDGVTDYRSRWPCQHYTGDGPNGYGGPEFFSVVDGTTGRELARANFIARGPEGQTPAQWAADWEANDWKWDPRTSKYAWKLANSLRLGAASFDGQTNQIFLGRGVYGRTIVEGWKYANGKLTRLWKLDTDTSGGNNKDGKPNSAYAGQGNHSFNVADLDGDGKDEVMYGSCAFDDDGTGLWSTGLGHGDANHVGKFLPDREGLQVFHCLETGKTQIALHDAATGATIWSKVADADNDMGRCMVADIDPNSPGCEFWMYGNWVYDQNGNDLGYNCASANMGIWFDGTLTRQLIDGDKIDGSLGRVFTLYRYDMSYNNGSKKNPGFVGDFLGDWREEVIMPSADKVTDIKVFTTWHPTEHKFPWLMTDHTYLMSCINENVGYNQPTNLGYYLGTDLSSDAEAWEAAGSPNVSTWGSKLAAGTYYLYNVESGQFITSGHWWGTHAAVDDDGMPVTLAGSGDSFTISTTAAFSGRYMGSDLYMDNKTAASWIFEKVSGTDNTYTMRLGSDYLTYIGNNNVATTTTPTTAASHWQLIKYSQLVSRLSTATPQNPIDASFYMTNARVRRGWPRAISGTELSDYGDFNTGSEGLYTGGVAAYGQWHKTFDNYQEMTGLPNGVYRIWAKGFYRENSDYPAIPYLYANNETAPLLKMGDIGTENDKNAAKALRDDTYLIGPLSVKVTDGNLRVGVKSDADVDWATFRQFTVLYLGSEEAYAPYAELDQAIAWFEATGDLPYADQSKKPVVPAAATSIEDAQQKTAALTTALRAYIESNGFAEGVPTAQNMTSYIVNPSDPTNNNGWTITGAINNPLNNEPWTNADGNSTHSYFDGGNWGGNSWETAMSQSITLPAGEYLLTVKARAAEAVNAYSLSVGGQSINLPRLGNAGNIFNRGWNDAYVVFESDGSPVTIRIDASSTTLHTWFSISDFRLMQLSAQGIDINNDGRMNYDDVPALIAVMLGRDPDHNYNHVAADVNKDGLITIADATKLINLLKEKGN